MQQQSRPGEISTEMMHDWLRRIGVAMAGDDVFEPYKD